MTILSRLRYLANLPANLEAAVSAMEGKHVADCRDINRGYEDKIRELTNERIKYATECWKSGCRTQELATRITELESELANARDAIKRQESSMATLYAISARRDELEELFAGTRDSLDCANNEIEELRGLNANFRGDIGSQHVQIKDLESTIAALRSGALPWRPIGEYESGKIAAFRHSNTDGYWASCALSGGATHFIYLDQPTTKPAPRVVAWAVVNPSGQIVYEDNQLLVWATKCNEMIAEYNDGNAEESCTYYLGTKAGIDGNWRAVRLVILED